MSKGYTLIKAKNGINRFMKDGRFTKVDQIPLDELDRLFGRKEPEPVVIPMPTELKPKSCVFCGMYTTWNKLVNSQTIPICQEHYYSETTGKIVQRVKEMQNV